MQALIDQLHAITSMSPENARRALGPYLGCYYSRLPQLCTALAKWQADYTCPVVRVPAKITELQNIAKLMDGIIPHDISDILDISLGIVNDASVRISKIKELEKNTKVIINESIEQLDKKNRIENSYFAFVEQYGGKIPESMKTTLPVITRVIDRSEIYRVLKCELMRMTGARKYVNRLKSIVLLVNDNNKQLIDAPTQINIDAIESRITAIENAIIILAPRCCNCAISLENLITDSLDCTRHPYCTKCAVQTCEFINLREDCPMCYYETRILSLNPVLKSKMNENNNSEFCTPVSHTMAPASIEREL